MHIKVLLLLQCLFVHSAPMNVNSPRRRMVIVLPEVPVLDSPNSSNKKYMHSPKSKHRLSSAISSNDLPSTTLPNREEQTDALTLIYQPLALTPPRPTVNDPPAIDFPLLPPAAYPQLRFTRPLHSSANDLLNVASQFDAMELTPASEEVRQIYDQRFGRVENKRVRNEESEKVDENAVLASNMAALHDRINGRSMLDNNLNALHDRINSVRSANDSNPNIKKQRLEHLGFEESAENQQIRSHASHINLLNAASQDSGVAADAKLSDMIDTIADGYVRQGHGVRGDIEEWKRSRSNSEVPVFGGSFSAFKAVKGKPRRFSE